MYRAENRAIDSQPAFRFVTSSLQVSFLKPTPLGPVLEVRGKVKEIKGRKVVVEVTVAPMASPLHAAKSSTCSARQLQRLIGFAGGPSPLATLATGDSWLFR